MTINYYLDKPQAGVKPALQQETAIYLFIRSGQSKIKLNIGRRVLPKCWDANKQAVKNMTGSPEFNGYLTGLKSELQSTINKLSTGKDKLTIDDVREAAAALIEGKEIADTRADFKEAFEEFVKAKQIRWSKSYLTKYYALKDHLEEYARVKKKPLKLERMNMAFIEAFSAHLLTYKRPSSKEETESKEALTNNTVVKAVSMLKSFLKWAVKSGYTEQQGFKDFTFDPDFSKDADTVALTEQELMSLYFLDLSAKPALANVRDVFCFSAFTLQRFSDVARLKPDHIKGNTWHLRTKKTGKPNLIPLNDFARAILERNGMELPTISNQQTNLHLATLGEIAGINEPITMHRYRGSEVVATTGPKFDFIGTHTARRTGATLLLKKGINFKIVMRLGGWKSFKSFEKYIRLADTDAEAAVMSLTWSAPAPLMQAV